MKMLTTRMWVLALTLATGGAAVAQDYPDVPDDPAAQAQVAPEVQEAAPPSQTPTMQGFQDALSPYGQWVQTPDYGRVWIPAASDGPFLPFTHGHWVWTTSGWSWMGDEPWAWAPYHYGRWVRLADYGWGWVPGYTWAPAWVTFRFGPSYVGWAPIGYGDDYDASWSFVSYDVFCPRDGYAVNVWEHRYDRDFVRRHAWGETQPGMRSGPPVNYVAGRVGHPVHPVAVRPGVPQPHYGALPRPGHLGPAPVDRPGRARPAPVTAQRPVPVPHASYVPQRNVAPAPRPQPVSRPPAYQAPRVAQAPRPAPVVRQPTVQARSHATPSRPAARPAFRR